MSLNDGRFRKTVRANNADRSSDDVWKIVERVKDLLGLDAVEGTAEPTLTGSAARTRWFSEMRAPPGPTVGAEARPSAAGSSDVRAAHVGGRGAPRRSSRSSLRLDTDCAPAGKSRSPDPALIRCPAASMPGAVRAAICIPDMTEQVAGTVLSERYALEDRIGVGGMATVYRAIDLTTGQPRRGQDPEPRIPARRTRRRPSATSSGSAARARSSGCSSGNPYVVQFVEQGVSPAGDHFIAMELLEGEQLRFYIGRGKAAMGLRTFAYHASAPDPRADRHPRKEPDPSRPRSRQHRDRQDARGASVAQVPRFRHREVGRGRPRPGHPDAHDHGQAAVLLARAGPRRRARRASRTFTRSASSSTRC